MAEIENNMEFSSGKSRFSFFNRSQTMHFTPKESLQQSHLQSTLDRVSSLNKYYSPAETVKFARNSFGGKVKKLCSLFESSKSSRKNVEEPPIPSLSKLNPTKSIGLDSRVSSDYSRNSSIRLPGTEDRIVLYFTSLRGIRRTFEDCSSVRTIFKSFRAWVDERDISMDSSFRKELQSVMGEKNVTLPQVFIGGRHVGGAEDIKHLCEVGELGRILKGFPKMKPGFVCEGCGDARFVPCMDCSGSRKIFDEDECELKRCRECNENGLIRCPDCCS